MDKYQKFRRHIRFCFSASIGGIFMLLSIALILLVGMCMSWICQD